MKSVLVRLNEYKFQMTSAETEAVKYILDHPDKVVEMSIHELADNAFTSASTIVRMCRHLGFKGYKELRRALEKELVERDVSRDKEIKELSINDSLEDIVYKITYKNIISLENTRNLIDLEAIKECVNLLTESKVLYFFGIGSSLCVARDAYLKFLRLDKLCVLNDDWHSQLLQSKNMTKDDVGIFISYSGQTDEVIKCAENAKKAGAKVIAITRFSNSTLSSLADYNLYVSSSESLFRNGAMSSRISQLNVVDILYTAYANSHYEYAMDRLVATHIKKTDISEREGEDEYNGKES